LNKYVFVAGEIKMPPTAITKIATLYVWFCAFHFDTTPFLDNREMMVEMSCRNPRHGSNTHGHLIGLNNTIPGSGHDTA
jgi:hypothetical protein